MSTSLDLDTLVAIDVHVHVHAELHGHLALDDELGAAAAKYFKGDPYNPTVPDIAAEIRDEVKQLIMKENAVRAIRDDRDRWEPFV